jgi:hypothetical protein
VYFAALDTRIDFLKARIEADPDYFAWREQLATAEKMFAELHDVPAHGQHAAATIADFYAK